MFSGKLDFIYYNPGNPKILPPIREYYHEKIIDNQLFTNTVKLNNKSPVSMNLTILP